MQKQATRILTAAFEKLSQAVAPDNVCPSNCSPLQPPEVIFRSIPKEVLTEYDNREYCRDLEAKTKLKPIVYQEREFADLAEVISWFGDVSQGDGPDGEDLYLRCDRECSPRYTVRVRKTEKGMRAEASIVCGEARDKDEGTFTLSTAYRFTCRKS